MFFGIVGTPCRNDGIIEDGVPVEAALQDLICGFSRDKMTSTS